MVKISNFFTRNNNLIIILILFLSIKLSVSEYNSDSDYIDTDMDDFRTDSDNFETYLATDINYTISNEQPIDTVIDSTDSTKNNTDNDRDNNNNNKKGSSLSTGSLLAIILPCIAAVLAAALAAVFCIKCADKPMQMPITSINNSANILTTGASVENVIQQSPPVPQMNSELVLTLNPETQVSQAEFVSQKLPYKKGVAPFPKVNRVFEPIYPVQKPVQQVVEVKQTIPTISQTKVSKVMAAPQPEKSQIDVTESIVSRSQVVSETKVLPDVHTSQVGANEFMPPKVLPQVLGNSQVLPPKVLPTINQGNVSTSYVQPHELQELQASIANNSLNIPNDNNYVSGNINTKPPHISKVSEELPINNVNNVNDVNVNNNFDNQDLINSSQNQNNELNK